MIERKSNSLAIDLQPSRWTLDLAAQALTSASGNSVDHLRGFRLNAPRSTRVRVEDRKAVYEGSLDAELSPLYRDAVTLTVSDDSVYATELGGTWCFAAVRTEGGPGASAHDGDILAPMPGKVIAVDIAEGQTVEAGQRLLVLEAMKMEHALTAQYAGTVAELSAQVGQQVQVEALLARVVKAGS